MSTIQPFFFTCAPAAGTLRYYIEGIGSLTRNNPVAAVKFVKSKILALLGRQGLMSLFLCPSHECNANCIHCYEQFLHDKLRKSLSTGQIKGVIDEFCSLGGCFLNFCSGEFLLRPDALELIRYAGSKNLAASITTNGLLLDEEMMNKLKAAGLWRLMVSIDSASSRRHDECRGVEGCFEKAVNGIRMAKKKGIYAAIWTYVSKGNFNELGGIEELAGQLNVGVFVFFTLLSGRLFNNFEENLSLEEREALRRRFNRSRHVVLEFPSETDMCRGGGHTHICVTPSGDVTYCPPVPYSYGNISSKTLRECLGAVKKDAARFSGCRGQCIVNFPEYRENCNAKFMYE